jgi:hypothetical protein
MKKKIRLTETELIGIITEIHNNLSLRRRFGQDLDDLEIRKVIRVVMNDKYLEDYVHYDIFVDDVVSDVTDYFFDENNIMIGDDNNYSLYREFYDYIKDEYESMIVKYYRNNTQDY